MSFATARQDIESFFATNWTATPVSYENVDFTPPSGDWVRLRIVAGESKTIGLGASRLVRHEGVVQVLCFVADGTGAQGADDLADDVAALFRTAALSGFVFRAASSRVDGADATHFQVTVTIPFWRDEEV